MVSPKSLIQPHSQRPPRRVHHFKANQQHLCLQHQRQRRPAAPLASLALEQSLLMANLLSLQQTKSLKHPSLEQELPWAPKPHRSHLPAPKNLLAARKHQLQLPRLDLEQPQILASQRLLPDHSSKMQKMLRLLAIRTGTKTSAKRLWKQLHPNGTSSL